MMAGAISSDRFVRRTQTRRFDDAKAVSWSIAAHPRDRRATAGQRRCRISRGETDACFRRAIGVRSVQHQRMMQTHLTRAHDHIMRRLDRHLRSHALRGQVVGVRKIGVRHEAETMRARHYAQTTVLSSRGRQPEPDRRYARLFKLFGETILMPADERVAAAKLVE